VSRLDTGGRRTGAVAFGSYNRGELDDISEVLVAVAAVLSQCRSALRQAIRVHSNTEY
jgi:hypothetical protein